MNTDQSANEPPIVMRKKFRVIAEIEVTVFEMPLTQPETELYGRTPYRGEGLQEFLDAENAVMSEMLRSPDDLRAWLSYRAACAAELESHAFEEWESDDPFLEPVIQRLSPEQQDLLDRSQNESLWNAVEAQIQSVRVEEHETEAA